MPADEVIGFQSSEEETSWLRFAYTGYLKEDFVWEEFGEEICSECANHLKIAPLGGNQVLIQGTQQTPINEILKDLDEWSSFWFEWLRPWSYVDMNTQRNVWTRWYGVPLRAWNSRFFNIIGAHVGRVLKIHDKTLNRLSLDIALIQVSTGLSPIDRVFECNIDGARFKIRVEEVRSSIIPEPLPEWGGCSESETETIVSASEEEFDVSHKPACAQIGTNGDKTQGLESEAGLLEVVSQPSSSPSEGDPAQPDLSLTKLCKSDAFRPHQKKKTGGENHLKLGLNRFLSQKNRMAASKKKEKRKEARMGSPRLTPHESDRVDSGPGEVRDLPNQTSTGFKEILSNAETESKIMEFGQKLGIQCNKADLAVLKEVTHEPANVGVQEISENVDQ
ncbi:uncharacterized protein LOC130998533 [Salvia miltiorrhiza]|uniref:uncharacterized protein LOC130998533 n=1 Tax=Salvia miltiorrhiza TaxID=226208 RepID=UPI0025ACED0B|nr:uncharacterized protein LOC130998533 [Salvia miltiorrhiza]